jgi:dienelactone hydrolase
VRGRLLAGALAAAALGLLAPPAGAATLRNYDLGRTTIPDPGPKGPVPIRLWGAIGVPDGGGKRPLVIVAHGRHGDNCPPAPGDSVRWPCFRREQRNDFGLRHVVRALARRGLIAVAPDLNGAYTIGWGEPTDELRWPRIVNRTLSRLTDEANSGGGDFGVDLEGRVNLQRVGLLAHSRSGHNAVRYARRGNIDSLFLLAPIEEGVPLPDRTTAIVLARCDGDVPGQGRRYFERAGRSDRDRPVFLIRLEGANHNWFNQTLVKLGRDDGSFARAGGCRRGERLGPRPQQRWLDKAASAFFAAALFRKPKPVWMRPGGPEPGKLYGLPVALERLFP